MTKNELAVLNAIRDLTQHAETGPSMREIAATAGVGLSKTHECIKYLRMDGKVESSGARKYHVVGAGPTRSELERCSDAEIRRLSLDLYEIGRERGLNRVMVYG